MSILRKLKKAKEKSVLATAPKRLTKEQADQINSEVTTQHNNAVFTLTGATYALWQRLAESTEKIMSLYRVTKQPVRDSDALVLNYADAALKSMIALDEHVRETNIITEDGVASIDDVHHEFYKIIGKMDFMSQRDLEVFARVAETITTNKRYIWIGKEEEYKDNLFVAMQHGMNLANDKSRKKVTPKDIETFLAINNDGISVNKTDHERKQNKKSN